MLSNRSSRSMPMPPRLAPFWASFPPNLLGSALAVMAQKLEPAAAEPDQAWQHTGGLSTLLQAAKQLPPREPWNGEDLDPEPQTGLGKLLVEARRLRAAPPQGGA